MSARPRIIFVNRFYAPDQSATAQILSDLAEALAGRGWRVSVITSRQLYGDPRANLPACETIRNVCVRRVWTSSFGRTGLVGRAVDYLSFYLGASVAMLRMVRAGDLLVAKTDPPLMSIPAVICARLRGARSLMWLQDLYPEIAVELGVKALRGGAGAVLRRLRNWSLRRATLTVAIGEKMRERLVREGIRPDQLVVMPNWSDDEAVRPIPPAACQLRREWGIEQAFVVAYSGNLGRAHEAETMLEAARRLRHRRDIRFVMIGAGHASDRLAATAEAEGLDNILFRPYQTRERLCESLAVGDLHWLSLKPEMEGLIVPSKLYGIAAAGRPVIAVTDGDGEVARLVDAHHCGVVVAPGDSVAFAAAVETYAAEPQRCAAQGEAARAMLQSHFRRADILDRWDRLCRDLVSSEAGTAS